MRPRTGCPRPGILGPPNYKFSKKTAHRSPQTREQSHTPCVQSVVADLLQKEQELNVSHIEMELIDLHVYIF